MGSVFQRHQAMLIKQNNLPCSGTHKWNGKAATIDDVGLLNEPCDCGKFLLNFEGCACEGTKKVLFKENPDYAG